MNVHQEAVDQVSGHEKRYLHWAEYLKVLAHPTRIAIVETLSRGTCCVTEVCDLLQLPQPNLSQHLAILRREGIVDYTEDGKKRCYYLLDVKKVRALLSALEQTVT
ncbi:MAG: ArsR/SmtB family transcription factor [Spirochaetota bacterium]